MPANMWRDMAPELSVLAFVLFMTGAAALTYFLTH